ncbi:unnamed protein product [Symbiodinium natans]|uniref:Protein phosphatase inhibitor 2 n=1 Tax=Symbiodinium natans TaxID=878477 RepID=A0A812PEN3_9DINO|nr:unnamed protein product [Symbiodinium natans]
MGDEKAEEENKEGEADERVKTILNARKRPRTSTSHVSWDEENLAEHDKERGTRQKIEEPPTPFVHSPASISEDEVHEAAEEKVPQPPAGTVGTVNAEELSKRLKLLEEAQAQAAPDAEPRPSAPASPAKSVRSVAFTEGGTPKTSSEAFKAKRAAHYNEFRVLQAFRAAAGRAASDDESSGSGKR